LYLQFIARTFSPNPIKPELEKSIFAATAANGKSNICTRPYGIGYTGATLNSNGSVAGGLAVYLGKDIFKTNNSSISVSTNLKLGIQDKVGSGLIIPIFFLFSSNGNIPNIDEENTNGGTIHLFAELPLLLHYNFGLGLNKDSQKRFGFYVGGGMSYTITGFADTADYSKGTSFFGCVMDGGVRFKRDTDINFAFTIPLRQPIGQISHPLFFELTLFKYF